MNKRFLCIPAALLLSLPAVAQEEEEPESPWSGKVGLAYLATSGNTENKSLGFNTEVGYKTGKWEHMANFSAINAEQNSVRSAEAYNGGWNTRYNFNESNYLFGRLNYLKDRFAGFEDQFSQTAGYGRRVIGTERHTLDLEIGAGAKQLEARDGTKEDDFIARGFLDYKWAFSDTAEFTQQLLIEAGDTNTLTESKSALNATLIGDLALVVSFTVRNNSDVPDPSFEKTDTFTGISLEYTF
ncbi:MAG: DUF481 domain-containing protein [Pseudomonadota bacterium]